MNPREDRTRDKRLMKWGGLSALVFVVLLAISIATGWVTGAGISFRAWVPLWCTLLCFLVVAALAGYDYLTQSHYALARIGMGFAALTVIIFFLEGAVWGADRIVLRAEAPSVEPGLTHLLALFNSLHAMVFWFVALWLGVWGAGFVQLQGKAKVAGVLMLMKIPTNMLDYTFLRLGKTGLSLDLYHLGSQVILLSAFAMLGLVLLEASRVTEGAGGTA